MLILLDTNIPRGMVRALAGHTVIESRERGWAELTNGDLLSAGERAGFHLLVTADQNIKHQQNLKGRTIALIVLSKGQWPLIRPMMPEIIAAVNAATPGSYVEVEIPYQS